MDAGTAALPYGSEKWIIAVGRRENESICKPKYRVHQGEKVQEADPHMSTDVRRVKHGIAGKIGSRQHIPAWQYFAVQFCKDCVDDKTQNHDLSTIRKITREKLR